eukprot:1441847-Rhodomonas_salina.1
MQFLRVLALKNREGDRQCFEDGLLLLLLGVAAHDIRRVLEYLTACNGTIKNKTKQNRPSRLSRYPGSGIMIVAAQPHWATGPSVHRELAGARAINFNTPVYVQPGTGRLRP